jgi:drug/metabolite transporter (DMT)-like permease
MKRWLGIVVLLIGLIWVGWCQISNFMIPNQVTSDELGRHMVKDRFTRDEMFRAIVQTGRGIRDRLVSPLPGVAAIIAGMLLTGHGRTAPRADG